MNNLHCKICWWKHQAVIQQRQRSWSELGRRMELNTGQSWGEKKPIRGSKRLETGGGSSPSSRTKTLNGITEGFRGGRAYNILTQGGLKQTKIQMIKVYGLFCKAPYTTNIISP
ncbi:hypothetical protein XENOCAPTIV_003331 [Xenoophorus captivus]|uniref:Uncharacterized protein n=1 Tax=Xenoophorus captivus TaxID=1517983 RepID=A0ABV0RFJ8_9TELE